MESDEVTRIEERGRSYVSFGVDASPKCRYRTRYAMLLPCVALSLHLCGERLWFRQQSTFGIA